MLRLGTSGTGLMIRIQQWALVYIDVLRSEGTDGTTRQPELENDP